MTVEQQSQQRQAKQLSLFEAEPEPSPQNKNGSSFNDPAFAQNKTLPVHRWVPWIAGFSRDFARRTLESYLTTPGVVLDPFAGVGTTLVEAILLGHDAMGFEINPYAALACRVKTGAHRIEVETLYDEISKCQMFYRERTAANHVPKSAPPTGFKTRTEFYSPRVLYKVLTLLDFADTVQNPTVQDLFRLAFAATMVRYSNYSYEPSLGRRASAGKQAIEDFPVAQTLVNKLVEMAEDITWLQSHLPSKHPNVQIISDTFFSYQAHLSPASVDLIVTSPPYLNNYHYNRNTRPQMYWLGYAKHPQDLRPLEEANFGKYWQTVREQDFLGLDFSLPDSDLAERLQTLRNLNRDKGIYGGKGWANYAAAYFNDCYRFMLGVKYVLKPGGTALVVIGNSILQGVLIPTDKYLGAIAEAAGLELVKIEIPRVTRVGNSIIQSDVRVAKAHGSHQLYEAVVELRKI